MDTTRVNHHIRAKEVRVVGAEGENLGVLPLSEAIQRAQDLGLDLIEISPNAVPPVAKIMEYGKFQYEAQKKRREMKSKSHTTETKSVQVKIGTGDHDMQLKAKRAADWLKEGHRVKVDLSAPTPELQAMSDHMREQTQQQAQQQRSQSQAMSI